MPITHPLNLTRLGWGLAIPVVFLSAIGLATVHATDRTIVTASRPNPSQPSWLPETNWLSRAYQAVGPLTAKQVLWWVGGVGLMLAALWPGYQKIGRFAYPFYGIVLVLLVLLVVDRFVVNLPDQFVAGRRKAWRWISFGPWFGIQPSEFMKVALVVALARYLRFRDSFRRWPGLIPPFLVTVVPMVLILFQPDLGTLLMLLPVLFAMLFVAGARLRHLLIIAVLAGATLPLFYLYGMADYQKQRIQAMFKQAVADERWHMNQGYQLRQSKIALGTGGLTGESYGQGVFLQSRSPLLPEEHNDFIFAMIGHQWGLLGCCLVLLAYGGIVLCGLEVATATNDPFGRLLAVGVIVMIVVQALINIGMTVGLAPITGMTLPFVSYGGSSLWANFLALGLLINIAQRRPMLMANPPFEHKDED